MNIKTKRVELTDFSGGIKSDISQRLLPLKYATDCYNFNTFNGALTDGVGLKSLLFNSKKIIKLNSCALNVYYFRLYSNGFSDKLLLYCQDKYIYCYDINSSNIEKIENLYFEQAPKGVYYRMGSIDIFIFSTEQEGVFVFDGESAEKVDNMPSVKDICLHNERLFAVSNGESTRLYFSDDFNPFNFNISLEEGGYIDLVDQRGSINKLVSSLGYLYIFRTHGISRLTSFYAQENFSVNHIFSCVGSIYANSVTPCESGIMFLSADGIYLISGNSVKKVMSNLDNYFTGVDNTDSKGIYFKGKFYLKCKIRQSGKEQDVLVVYSIKDDYGYICKNLNIKDFCSIMGEEYSMPAIIANNGSSLYTFCDTATILNVPLTKVWESPFTDLGVIGKDKVLKKIELYTNSEVKIKVVTDKVQRSFLLKPKNNYAVENVSIKGLEFKFVFISTATKCEISKPTLTFSYV